MPEVIAGEKELPRRSVPKRKGKHPTQMIDARLAILLVEVENHFDVRSRPETVPPAFEVSPKFRTVVDFAVTDELQGLVLVGDRLGAAFEIDDAQPRVAQRHTVILEESHTVRPPVRKRIGHTADRTAALPGDDTYDSAHSCRA